MRDIILQDLIQNIFPDILTNTIAWAATRNHINMDKSPKILCYGKEIRHTKDYIPYDPIYMMIKNRPNKFMAVEVTCDIWNVGRRLEWKCQSYTKLTKLNDLTIYFIVCKI